MKNNCFGRAFKLFTAVVFCATFLLLNTNSAAAEAQPTFTDDNGVTWIYSINTDDTTPVLSIGFKASPSDATTIKIPSLSEVKSKIGDTSLSDLDTYFVDNLIGEDDTSTIPSTLAKVDMTDAQKVQIRSLSPLFTDNTNEIELVFGDDVVIADN